MIIHRRTHTNSIEAAGQTATLVARTWTIAVDHRFGGVGWSYRRPCRIELTGDQPVRRPICDHVMVARLAGLALITSLSLIRRFRHGR